MTQERATVLLSRIMGVVVDRFELDGGYRIFEMVGFTDDELKSMGYGDTYLQQEDEK